MSIASRILEGISKWFSGLLTIDWKATWPLGLRIEHGAIIIGNSSTPCIAVTQFAVASGTVDAAASRCQLDEYKLVLNLRLKRVQMHMNENPDYSRPMLDSGLDILLSSTNEKSALDQLDFANIDELLKSYKQTRPTLPNPSTTEAEYAHWEDVLNTRLLEVTYCADTAGKVQMSEKSGPADAGLDVGNGDLPPEWGVELVVHDAALGYGPWTDRQRVEIMRAFFPSTFTVTHPTPRLQPGDTRVCIEMTVLLEFRGVTSLRLPFRKASEDWKYDGQDRAQGSRTPANLSIKIGDGSILRYSVPMIATEQGYSAVLDLTMKNVAVAGLDTFESVFLDSESCRVLGTMPSPLQWNAHRQWDFMISLVKPDIFLLRDHVTLIQDLIKDWASGPPTDPYRFIPTTYAIKLALSQFHLILNVNDHNIVDHLTDRERNALLDLSGASLTTELVISGEVFRPERSTIPFSIQAPDVSLALTLPKWNTHAVFATPSTTDIGRIGLLQLDGTFAYYADTRWDPTAPELVDKLTLDIRLQRVAFKCFGWAIRHFMALQTNYLGMFTNQKLTAEYLQDREEGRIGDPVQEKWRPGRSNAFEVIVEVQVEDGMMILPAALMGSETTIAGTSDLGLGHAVALEIPELGLTLRLHDYAMDMSLNIQPITGAVVPDITDNQLYSSQERLFNTDTIWVGGMHITGNRMFGPQPNTSTYLCIWDFGVESIRSTMTYIDTIYAIKAFTAVGKNFADIVNAPAQAFAVKAEPDVTFLRLKLISLDIMSRVNKGCIHFALPKGLDLAWNDLAGQSYKSMVSVRSPICITRALVSLHSDAHHWLEAASFRFDMFLDLYSSPAGWTTDAQQQREFCAASDRLTLRAPLLYESGASGKTSAGRYLGSLYLPHAVIPDVNQPAVDVFPSSHPSIGRLSRMTESPSVRRPSAVDLLREDSGDDDDDLSEAERDALLARSRPITPKTRGAVYADVDNDSVLSSNESDDDESAGENSSDSEWSGAEDATARTEAWPYVSSYIKIVPRFRAGTGLHSDSPLVLLDSHPSLWRHASDPPHRSSRPAEVEPKTYLHAPSDDDRISRTTIRLRSTQQIEICVTPLLVYLVENIVDAEQASPLSFELLVDDHISSAISRVVSNRPRSPGQTIFDINIPSIRVRALQRIMSADEAAALSLEKTLSQLPTQSQIVSIIDVQLMNLGLLAATAVDGDVSPFPVRRLEFKYNNLSLHVRAAQSHAQSGMNRSSKSLSTEVEVNSGPVRACIFDDAISLKTGAFDLDFQEHSSEAVIGTAVSAIRTVRQISSSLTARSEKNKHRFRRLILASTRALKPGMVDPLSQAQPSVLLSTGLPEAIRMDAQWRILTHTRHLFRFLTAQERTTLLLQLRSSTMPLQFMSQESDEATEMNSVRAILRQRLGDLLFESEGIQPENDPLRRLLYPTRKSKATASLATDPRLRRPIKLSFASNTASFALLKADDRTDELVSGPLEFQIHTRQMILTPEVVGVSSQASLNKSAKNLVQRPPILLQVSVSVKIESSTASVSPNLVPFTRHLLRVVRGFSSHLSPAPKSPPTSPSWSNQEFAHQRNEQPLDVLVDVNVLLPSMMVSTRAQHIALDCQLEQFQVAITTKLTHVDVATYVPLSTTSIGAAVKFESLGLFARDLRPKAETPSQVKDILASLIFRSAAVCFLAELNDGRKLRSTFQMQSIHMAVPRSVLRLYRLAEEWRTDYLPELELMLKGLVSELDKKPKAKVRVVTPSKFSFDVRGGIHETRVTLHIMHGNWTSWKLREITAYGRSSFLSQAQTYGLEIGGQSISVATNAEEAEDEVAPAVRIALPAGRAAATLVRRTLTCMAVLDTFDVRLKPEHFEKILVLQQKFGADFNELIDVVTTTRQNRPARSQAPATNRSGGFLYAVQFKVNPFKIGLGSTGTATQWFNVRKVSGIVSNVDDRVLQVSIRDVGLALTPSGTTTVDTNAIAYISVDVHVLVTRKKSHPEEIEVHIPRVHAVMQPSSIGELGDLVDTVQGEILRRSQQRSAEILEMRSKTKRVLRAWDLDTAEAQPRDAAALLNNRIITLAVSRLGIAFPLCDDIAIALHAANPHASATFATSSTPAFLLSIASMKFTTRRDEAGTATMQDLALQFVPTFNQAVPVDFESRAHDARNQLRYPRFSVDVRARTSSTTRSLHVSGDVEGFILNLEPSIVDYVFKMFEVYRAGKLRLQTVTQTSEEVAASLPRSTSEPTPRTEPVVGIPTSNVRLKLTFASGRVNLFPPRSSHRLSKSIFELPKLTVWTEYKATAAAHKFGSGSGDGESSMLLLSGLIHSSHNTLTPTILPFVVDITHSLEARMKQRASPNSSEIDMPLSSPRPTPPVLSTEVDVGRASVSAPTPPVIGSMQLHLSLRIDESSLQLSCAPDVEITSGLYWKSGGFSLAMSPGAEQTGFSGYISGVTAKLQHAFVPETFFDATTENLAFAVTYSKSRGGMEPSLLSVIIDAELSVDVNMHRLQDGFCFKAIWLDRIPTLNSSVPHQQQPMPLRREFSGIGNDISTLQRPTKATQAVPLTTTVLFRSRLLRVALELPRVATAKLEVVSFVGRANVSEVLADIGMSFSQLSLTCDGHISGTASIPDFTFQTLRRRNRSEPNPSARDLKMLQLFITSGRSEVSLFSSGYRDAKLFHYEADPVRVHAFDDWAKTTADISEEQQLSLNFLVDGTSISASIGLLVVSKALEMQQKVQTLIKDQRNGALRDSRAFRSTWTPAPANPLSNVAEAMITSARTRLKEEKGFSYAIVQNMRLQLESLRLHVFPNSLRDNQVVFVHGVEMFAHLRRVVASDELPLDRTLLLSFSSLFMSKFTSIPTEITSMPATSSGSGSWMHQVLRKGRQETILSVPGLRARMLSQEIDGPPDGALRVVKYRFRSSFRRTAQSDTSDIYVTLNYTLFTDLNELKTKATDAIARFKRDAASSDAAAVSAARKTAAMQQQPTRSATSPPSSPPVGSQRPAMDRKSSATPSAPLPDVERPTIAQMGEATPGLRSSFLGYHWDLETPIPHWLHEFGTIPLEELMKILLNLYSKQLKTEPVTLDPDFDTRSNASGQTALSRDDASSLLRP
ncbi:hypothetical protein BKA62DRAFT_705412 [Auriculariales sp. MPI-PUGE-AT-0066]|nr:hypothetical protein BKA62DRAFT_705412 [Auriculariales sp. MPI-PUGE-AT-0066]